MPRDNPVARLHLENRTDQASLAKIFGPADGMKGMLNSGGRGPNFDAQLVHCNLQMRSFDATESTLNHSKQLKDGEYEQGREN
jgi:hypothetical protein